MGNTNTTRAGEFAFVNVPIGLQQVGIDLSSLPVDFDVPQVPLVQVELKRGETRRLAFGLVPLGSIGGRVVRDENENGAADAGEELLDGAVLVLNRGARSELAREGRFQFNAVRSGAHTVTLLLESLPDGSAIVGSPSVDVTIGRESLAPETTFLVSIRRRLEVRKVFPAGEQSEGTGTAPPAKSASAGTRSPGRADGARPFERTPGRISTAAPPPKSTQRFAIQIAALNDPSRAARLVEELRLAGFAAYLVQPPSTNPDAPYKVRIGPYEDRAVAEREARVLQKHRGEKLWLIMER